MKGTLVEGAGSPGSGTGGGWLAAPQVVPGIVDKLFQPPRFENLLLSGQATGNTVRYAVEGTARPARPVSPRPGSSRSRRSRLARATRRSRRSRRSRPVRAAPCPRRCADRFAIGPLDDRRVMFMDMIERAREIVDRAAEVIDDHRPWSSSLARRRSARQRRHQAVELPIAKRGAARSARRAWKLRMPGGVTPGTLRGTMRIASCTGLLLTIAVAWGAGATSAWAVSDTVTGPGLGAPVTFHPFTIPSDAGCVRWEADGSYNCDPVNVILPGRSPAQVVTLLERRGWTTFGLGGIQWLHFSSADLYPADIQVFRADGVNALGQTMRYHVRLWQVRPGGSTVTVGAVHHEAETALFQDTIDRDWDASEAFLARHLCRRRCLTTDLLPQQHAMQGGTAVWRGWANDAHATIVPLPPGRAPLGARR